MKNFSFESFSTSGMQSVRSEAFSPWRSIFSAFFRPFSWQRPNIPDRTHSDPPIAIPLPKKPIPASAAAATTGAPRRSRFELS